MVRLLFRKRWLGWCLGWFLCLAGPPPAAQPLDLSPAAQRFRASIDTLFQNHCADGVMAGVKMVSMETHTTLFEKNPGTLFVPASNMKLVTTATALHRWGPDFRFHTRIYSPGKIRGRTLHGDVYLKGFGDPFLVTEQMWLLVNELRQLPLDRIEGDVYVDDSYFTGGLKVATWDPSEGPEAYLAPLGALSFNFNTVAVHVAPGKRPGDRPVVVIDPDIPYLRLANSAVTTRGGRRGRLIVNRHRRDGGDVVTVSGSVPLDKARKTHYLNITDPTTYTGQVFMKFLRQAGVEVTGVLRQGLVPEGSALLLDHESPPLADILQGLNKYSNNFIAEQILRTLAAREFGPPGTTENGVRLLRDYLAGLGFPRDSFTVVDGSGLSRQNRLSPEQLVAVLMDAHEDLSIFPEFISALAIMGLDGSVDERMTAVPGSQRIRAKTGTLNHVSALSGYFQSSDGEVFAFSILLNGLRCSNGRAHQLQDAIMTEALRFSRRVGGASSKEAVSPEEINP